MASLAVKAPKTAAGSKLGKYTLGDLLGQGAYGAVHLGEQKTGPRVAVKVLDAIHARDPDTIERFKREADTARRLDHPSIVRVLDVGSSRGRHYLVMELVGGGSLQRLLKRDDPPAPKVLSVLIETARALAYAHAQGVVHRDIKPANILLTRSGRAKVADFGLARAVDQSSMTTEGRLLGTASYMSPEQAKGERATSASDVYAMGILLYEAISGGLPFTAESHIGYLYQHAEVEPPRPTVRPPYPPALANLALECLAKPPGDRPTMAQVADRMAAMSLVRPRRIARLLLVALAALVVLAAVTIAVPRVLGPLRALRGPAQHAHDAIFGR